MMGNSSSEESHKEGSGNEIEDVINPIEQTSTSATTSTGTIAPFTPTCADVVMLVRNIQNSPNCVFPVVLMLEIMSMSDFSPEVCQRVVKDSTHRGHGNQNEVYLSIPIVPPRYAKRLSGLCFKITSKDQGWSSYPSEQGTRTSNTWGEASLSTGNNTDTDITSDARFHVYRNIHAGREFETQTITFDVDSDLCKAIIQLMKANHNNCNNNTNSDNDGNTPPSLQLWLRSMYPGWQQTVSYAEVRMMWRFSEYQQFACDKEKTYKSKIVT
jgi:hypothetical protein